MLGLNSVGELAVVVNEWRFSTTLYNDKLLPEGWFLSWEWWFTPTTSGLGRLDWRTELKICLDCITRPYLEKAKNNRRRGEKEKKILKMFSEFCCRLV